jgi:hypothetical protein
MATVWNEPRSLIVGEHGCYLCQPFCYPPMIAGHTLCAICGVLHLIDGSDPLIEGMSVCDECDERLRKEAQSALV